jgi:predicted TIM-barrel fold metal-dependent hydrolase
MRIETVDTGTVPGVTSAPERHTQADLRLWHARHAETILEPDLPVIDAHHHMWDRPPDRYQLDEILRDLNTGHCIDATCFAQCTAMYRTDGPEHLKPIGETEYVNGVAAASASGIYGPARICAAISGYADLRLGARVSEVLEGHMRAGGGRFRGIRQQAQFDPVLGSLAKRPVPQGLLGDAAFREGYARLADFELLFEAWVFFTQLSEVADLAARFPSIPIVLNHLGGPIAIGPYAESRQEHFRRWHEGMTDLARRPNVFVKLGGLGMKIAGFGFEARETPPSSLELAAAWRPHIETTIGLFGVERCMFESNFPMDATSASYPVLWNAFKRLTAGAARAEREALFSRVAATVYRLHLPSRPYRTCRSSPAT